MHDKDRPGDDAGRPDNEHGERSGAPSDADATWAQIVASFDTTIDEPVPRWPVAEDVSPAHSEPEGEEPPGAEQPTPPTEEHFVPPPPPPLPRGDAISRAAWAGVLGGPAFLLVAAITGADIPTWLAGLAIGAFVAGFITLVARMRDRDPYDPDDGAIV